MAAKVDGKRIFSRAQLAAILLSIGLVFTGLSDLLKGHYDDAAKAFAGAMGTAGLPAVWSRGWTITSDDPAFDGTKGDDAE